MLGTPAWEARPVNAFAVSRLGSAGASLLTLAPLKVPLSVASPSVDGSADIDGADGTAAAFISVGSDAEWSEPMYEVGSNVDMYDGSIAAAPPEGAWKAKASGSAGMPVCAVPAAWVRVSVPGIAVSTAGAAVVSRAGSSGTLGAARAGPAKPRPSAAIPAAAAVVRMLRRAMLLISGGSLQKLW